ncbi:fungal-specific transcription factor domain-containing protein [Fennellomyces sp. T-0311]|nr:fungal-specific transcription factor domain-containing protein [Fennellomyces sp. T-0311]
MHSYYSNPSPSSPSSTSRVPMYSPANDPQQQSTMPSTMASRSAGAPKTQIQQALPSLDGSHPTLPMPRALADEHSTDASRQKRTKKDRACDLCRRKKIRCDYSQAYPQLPCTSCKSYGKQCTFNEAAKKRGPPKGYVEGLENRLRRMEEMLMNVASAGRLSPESFQDLMQDKGESKKHSEKRQKTSSEQSNVNSSNNSNDNNEMYSYVGSSSGLHLLGKLFPESDIQSHSNDPSAFSGHESDLMMKRRPSETGGIGVIIPDSDTSHEWQLPHKEVIDRLLELYFKKMNIYIPIVDETEFYERYNSGSDALSITLVISICRAATRLLDEDDWVVKKHNIDRCQLFVSLADQLQCVHVDFMNPGIDKIQILLLQACSARKWSTESTDWLAVSLAVKMAQDLGLHRSNTQLGIPTHQIEARKRLWWSAYVLDRWICATLGRPLTISDADCDVELPSTEGNRYLFLLHFIKLSAILGDVLRILCSPRARTYSDKRCGMDQICRSLNNTLEEWEQNLPDQWRLSPADMDRIERQDLDVELEVKLNSGAAQLRLGYYSVLLLLTRPFVSKTSEFEVADECYDATHSILNIVEVVQVKSWLSFSWSLTSYIMFQVLIVTLLLLRNQDQRIAASAKMGVERLKNQYRRAEAYIPEVNSRFLIALCPALREYFLGKLNFIC